MLALTFVNPTDYDKVQEADRISILYLSNMQPGKNITCVLYHKDGTKDEIALKHSYNDFQIQWFKAGSALNILREREAQAN